MATRSFRPSEGAPITDATQVMGEDVHNISVGQLIPRIAERSKKAVDTVPIHIYFYQGVKAGRRCSCFDIETSPDGQCEACFGTGVVGGFDKYGTTLEVLDVTHPSVVTTNIFPDWSSRRKPIPFSLIQGARFGVVEARIKLTTNVGVVDALSADYILPEGTKMEATMKSPADTGYVALTKENLQQRLFNPYVDLRISLWRVSPEQESPLLKSVYMRYKNVNDYSLKANIPRVEKSIALQEIGIADEWSGQLFYLDNTLKTVSTEDYLVSIEGDTRWKIRTAKENAPHGQLTSWDLEARLVQEHESFMRVPV
jgi:hypothetical protein